MFKVGNQTSNQKGKYMGGNWVTILIDIGKSVLWISKINKDNQLT